MTTTRRLVLIRHSQTEPVADVPANQWLLSAEGRRRCDPLALRLQAYQPDVIVTSPEPKARETSELIAEKLGVQVIIGEKLYEHDRSGEPYTQHDLFLANVAAFFANPTRLMFGNETAASAYIRFSGAIKSLLCTYEQQNLAIVAHGTVITLYVAHAMRIPAFEFWRKLGMPALVVLSLPDKQLVEVVEEIR